MPSAVMVKCVQCGKFLAELPPGGNAVRVACHGLSILVERSEPLKAVPTA